MRFWLLSLPLAQSLCRWPVPLPAGYLISCSTSDELPAEDVDTCGVTCDELSWHFGSAELSCDNVTGLLSLSGCTIPSCPTQCGAYSNLGSVPGAQIKALAVDHRQQQLLAVDETQHVVLALGGLRSFSTQVLWGASGLRGDADGEATASARLAEPFGMALTSPALTERLLFVADTGNGKVRMLNLVTSAVSTVCSGFLEPKSIVLLENELLVADAAAGYIARLPVELASLALGAATVAAATLEQLEGSLGLSRPTWLGYRSVSEEVFVTEASGAFGTYRMMLNGTRSLLLASGTWSSGGNGVLPQPRALAAVTAPGPLALNETVGFSNLLLVDSVEKRLFALELMKSGRSCADLDWDSDHHGSPKICGRSAGDAALLGSRCNYTYGANVCCSGAVNLADAEIFCSQQGARLCTQEELFDNEASDGPVHPDCITGPSFVYDGPYDRTNIWSSSPCFVEGTGLPGFMTRSGTRSWGNWAPDECRMPMDTAFVKCCADRDLVMPMAGFEHATIGTAHSLFQKFTANTITAVAADPARRFVFLALGGELALLALGAQGFIAAGQIGFEDVIGNPGGIAWSEEDALLLADRRGHVLRRVDVLLTGSNDIVAGTDGVGVDGGDGGLSVTSTFYRPTGLAVAQRVAYVSTGQHRVRRVELTPNGGITTEINVDGVKGIWGDRGPGVEAELSDPQNLFVTDDERIFVADRNNHRVRMLDQSTGRVDSVAGPLMVTATGSGYQAEYAFLPDPNMTSSGPPKDLVTTSPVGLAVAPDGSFAIVSDEHSQSMLHLDRSVVPRRVRVIQGTKHLILDPKDLLLAENGTLFVSDHASHSIFALEFICDRDAEHYTGGCRAVDVRRVLGAGAAGDGDMERRQPSTLTSTTTTSFTSTFTSTLSELPCWNHILGKAGEDCDSTCARYQGTCDPDVRSNFDFEAFQSSVFWEERVTCQRDSRSWWDDAMPSFETNRDSRNFGWCLGTFGMPAEIPCNALFMEYGQASATMRRWCKCRRESMCYLTTSTTIPPPFIATSTSTRTWTGVSSTATHFSSTTQTVTVTLTTRPQTTSPSPYVQACPQGYDPLSSPLPLTAPNSQNSARDCAVFCEVSAGCVAFAFDATVGLCSLHQMPSGDFPLSTDPGSVHYTCCVRDASMVDVLLELLLVDWMPSSTPLHLPGPMALDNARQLLYFSDMGNHKIKVFDLNRNLVMTAAGIGESYTKFSGDGQPAREATMATPRGLALDEENSHLYLSDSENHVIRRIRLGESRLTGIIESVAGTAVGGLGQDGLDPSLTRFNYPYGLALERDAAGVKLYVADSANHQVVLVDLASAPNIVRKIAGKRDGSLVPTEVGDKGPALEAQVFRPQAMAFANGTMEVFFAEPAMERLRQMDMTSGIIDTALETYAVNFSIGEGLAGVIPMDYDAALSLPYGVATMGNILLTASYGTGQVRQTNLTSGITTDFAGRRNEGYFPVSSTGDGGPATFATLAGPVAVTVDHGRQVVYIAESDSGQIRQVNLSSGLISTLLASVPPAGETRSLYSLSLDPLRQLLYASSPSAMVVYGYRLESSACVAPVSISNAASPACAEGTEVYVDHCTTQCANGYEPNVPYLHCSSGVLTPSSFTCFEAPCLAPWGIAHSSLPSCSEGMVIASGSRCTAQCNTGEPDGNLTCDRGTLQPTTFTCVQPTTLTVTVTGGQSVSGGGTVTAAPAPSMVNSGSVSTVSNTELQEGIFGDIVFDPSIAPRSSVALNGSFTFEALTAGLTLSEVSLLCASEALQQPLREALVEMLKLLPGDLHLLALLPQLPTQRRLAESATPTHGFSVAFTVPTPPVWAELRFNALRLGTPEAKQAWSKSLEQVHFIEAMQEISMNRNRPCRLPPSPPDAPPVPCQEGQVTTSSLDLCSTKCLTPLLPSTDSLRCFAGFWSPSTFSCLEAHEEELSCPVPTGIPDAADLPCQGIQASIASGSFCTPQCRVGLESSEPVLACIRGDLQPSSFSCINPDCVAPNVSQAQQPSCLEGFVVPATRQCTAACLPGFRATANLSCLLGQLVPSRFLCTDSAVAESDSAATDFWGIGGGNGVLSTTGTSSATESPATLNATETEKDSANDFWGFVSGQTFVLVAAFAGGIVVLCLLCCLWIVLRRWCQRSAAAKEAATSWESTAEEVSRQNSVFDSPPSKSPRKRKSSGVSLDEATKDVANNCLEGSSDSNDVKEILRMMAGEQEGPANPEAKVEDGQDMAETLRDVEALDVNEVEPEEGDEPELLRLAIEAAEEVERTPQDAASAARKKDAVFEAMDRDIGEAVAVAAEAAPLQSKSRSWIAQKPEKGQIADKSTR